MLLPRSFLLLAMAVLLLDGVAAGKIKGATNKSRRLKKIAGPKHRTCVTSLKDQEVKFECRTKSGDNGHSHSKDDEEPEAQSRGISIVPDAEIKDKIKYKIKTTDEGISIKLEYKNEVEMDDTETETKTKFELIFSELVEYVKKNPEADEGEAYDWEEDEIVQSIPLTEWMDIPGIVDDADGVVSYFTATTMALGMEGGSAAFNFTISRADQSEMITANSMKIDVRILDFPWARTDSYVALLSSLESQKKVKVEYEREATAGQGKGKKAKDVTISFDEDMESTFGFSTYGEYSWAHDAAATGAENAAGNFSGTVMMARQSGASESLAPVNSTRIVNTTKTIEVIATSPEDQGDDNSQLIAYSFVGSAAQGASDIYWDPEAGIGYQSGVGQLGFFMGLVGTSLYAFFSLVV